MNKLARNELVQTIESQSEQIAKYQNKLRDLVAAYKGILKEKEALENSLKALSETKKSSKKSLEDKDESPEKELNDDGEGNEASSDVTQDDNENQLQAQLATLSLSLTAVSEEKSRLQANFMAEKKSSKLSYEDVISKLKSELAESEEKVVEYKEQIQDAKNKIRIQQQEREKEHNDHALMIQELQQLVAAERIIKETYENQIDELKQRLDEKQTAADLTREYENKMLNLSNELEAVRQRLKSSEIKASLPSPLLLDLQEEMAEMKAQHRIALEMEKIRVQEVEEQRKVLAKQSESRVSSLEAKLSELSDCVGTYERTKYQDQQAIQRMRERITQLDSENTALARAAHRSSEDIVKDEDESNLDIETLIEKITHLKGLLKLANQTSANPIDLAAILHIESQNDQLHKHCHEEYDQLKEEFERYKLRAQSILKNRKESPPPDEIDTLKKQINELKDRCKQCQQEKSDFELCSNDKINVLHQTIDIMQKKHEEDSLKFENDNKQKLAALEVEIRRHRERTIALLAEKDKEIETLRLQTTEGYETQYLKNYRSISGTPENKDGSNLQKPDSFIIKDLISHSTSIMHPATTVLHFAQEQARKDVEISMLRKQKHAFEVSNRELHHESCIKESRLNEKIENLNEELRRFGRAKSRESANLEYLKNVVYQYMISYDVTSRYQMLNAISTILQFSPIERDSVEKKLSKSWWAQSNTKVS